jgi:predicted extracellular nuclease
MNVPACFRSILGFVPALLVGMLPADCQDLPGRADQPHFRVMFYNAENFFDTRNDSLTADDEFTPYGARHWNSARYHTKLNNLYKTIIALGAWQAPDIIGICEIENRYVLDDLLNHTPLSKYAYRIIQANSPDKRGIDVALLYNSETVTLMHSGYFNVGKKGLYTRDILYFKALLARDTCHFFMNHWPSRSAGQLETEADRMAASARLRTLVDSLFNLKPAARILIMGDFNDEPGDESLTRTLQAETNLVSPIPGHLYNLSTIPPDARFKGTVKFRGQWTLFDQAIVSGGLLNASHGIYIGPGDYHIFGSAFLLMPDEQYNGFKPYRTYNGYKYQGGFSDHLPVYVDLGIR